MLTCAFCGEEIMLEEDMKTHLLLSHMENDLRCPLCSLSGVSYDELSFHISSAHPEMQDGAQDPPHITGLPAAANTQSHKTPLSSWAQDSCKRDADATHSSDTSDSMCLKQDITSGSRASSTKETSTTLSPTRRQKSVMLSNKDNNTFKSEHSKAKQKRLSSKREEELFSCPMCPLVCSSFDMLQEHVELHLQEQRSTEGSAQKAFLPAMRSPSAIRLSGEKRLECPLCSVVCMDSFSLQEHVELHLEHGAAASSAAVAHSPGSDLRLARELQQEEEARQEREDFKKLQKQFGLDGGGGYCRQMERSMEKAVARGILAPSEFHCKRAEMMESLASGVDDGRTRTRGVLRALSEYYQSEGRDCVHVWLSADTDHYCSSAGDSGWGCGYRNIQMLLSSLHTIDAYAPFLPEKAVPSIPRVQSMIEEAWKEGLDPHGASHFNQRLQGTRAWIGATEIYALLTSLGTRHCTVCVSVPASWTSTGPQALITATPGCLTG
ncbi:zinc finger-containing ubiquitin peptidase 1 isoform X2 [Eleginops maclovinus]|uniref:zinc finger-containing ubiquitin peptidase 1 isoform X2 n=1 Tax=Eleginops maclovinus TaxID=56733 RepID=UPI003080EBD7